MSGSERAGGYDLAVIGAGSAGFSAFITAAGQGARVALIGHGMIGGTCVNDGCVPSKTMIRAAEAIHQANAAARFAGIVAEARINDWPSLIAQKDELVASLRQSKYSDVLSQYDNTSYFEGAARLVDGGVTVGGRKIEADRIIIATGASPATPHIDGLDDVPFLTSGEALELKELPRSLALIGGGYIGCELAQMFARMGVEVAIACRSRLLPGTEPEISAALTGYLRDEGIAVHDAISYRSIRRTGDGVAIDVREEGRDTSIVAERLLVATGRRPNTNGMGLRENGIELRPGGGVRVDDRMRTSRRGVYAAGDVTGVDQFVYMAAYGAKIAARNALGGDAAVYDNSAMMWVVFSDPQVAGVGLSEASAKARGIDAKTAVITLDHLPRAMVARDTRGLVKLVADKKTNRLLGAQILAPEGADTIQTAVLAIKHGMTVDDLAAMTFPYLTTVEGLKLAAQSFDMDVEKLSCCAG